MKPVRLDLSTMSVRELNDYLHHRLVADGVRAVEILNPNGMHNIAVGLDAQSRCTYGQRRLLHRGHEQAGSCNSVRQRGLERGREHHVGQRAG